MSSWYTTIILMLAAMKWLILPGVLHAGNKSRWGWNSFAQKAPSLYNTYLEQYLCLFSPLFFFHSPHTVPPPRYLGYTHATSLGSCLV